ncbi:polysaccharide deacetylase family protein, partial [bacterium]|nr:polysaccharide deacetylase family protein [bacterium]
MKKFLALFTFSFFFIISPFITPNAVNINAKEIKILDNPMPFYFENSTYYLGKLYGIKNDPEILKEYENLFSEKDTFCIVLIYHNIYTSKRINSYDVSKNDFLRHIEILKKYRFESITLNDLYYFVKFNKKIPKRSVIFTFDDGFKSVMLASDILKENGFNGVISLITGYIESSWEVNKSEIKKLLSNNFEISLHSHKLHNFYLELIKEKIYKKIEEDIKASKKYFKDNFNEEPIAFSYPQGAFDDKIENILKNLNFKLGLGLCKNFVNKYGEDPFYISRVEISERRKYSDP